jgi:hypothetical protein
VEDLPVNHRLSSNDSSSADVAGNIVVAARAADMRHHQLLDWLRGGSGGCPPHSNATPHNATGLCFLAQVTSSSYLTRFDSLNGTVATTATTWPPSPLVGHLLGAGLMTLTIAALPPAVPCWVAVPLYGPTPTPVLSSAWWSTNTNHSEGTATSRLVVTPTLPGGEIDFNATSSTLQNELLLFMPPLLQSVLYVRLDRYPSASSSGTTTTTEPRVLLLSCEGFQIEVTVVLQWPENEVSLTSEVLATTAAIASLALNAADVTSAVSAVMVTFLSCSAVPPGRSATSYVLSVFFDLGYGAMAIGNALLILVIAVLHFAIALTIRAYRRRRYLHNDMDLQHWSPLDHPLPEHGADDVIRNGGCGSVAILTTAVRSGGLLSSTLCCRRLLVGVTDNMPFIAKARFPALSMRATALLAPGSVFGAAAALAMLGDTIAPTSPLSATGAVFGIFVSILLMILIPMVLLRWVVEPLVQYTPYFPEPLPGPRWEQRFLYPGGRWTPEKPCRAFRPLFTPMRAPRFCFLIGVDAGLALLLAGVTGAIVGSGSSGNGAACGVGPIIVALTQYAYFAVLVFVRPHRLPVDRVCTPLYHALLGTVCTLKYIAGDEESVSHVADAVQQSLVCVQLVKTLCGAYVTWYRETNYRSQLRKANIEANEATNARQQISGDCETILLPLVDDCKLRVVADAVDPTEDASAPTAVVPLLSLYEQMLVFDGGDGLDHEYWDEHGVARHPRNSDSHDRDEARRGSCCTHNAESAAELLATYVDLLNAPGVERH